MGRTPWSAADALVGLLVATRRADQGSGADEGVRPTYCSIRERHYSNGLANPIRRFTFIKRDPYNSARIITQLTTHAVTHAAAPTATAAPPTFTNIFKLISNPIAAIDNASEMLPASASTSARFTE